ncbi:MAG: PIN domain-containing protein [Rhodocyclales bacterium]|nr:PIN domain-containing protein [Rhodocyclales bacterium]
MTQQTANSSSTQPALRVVLDTNVLVSLYVFADSRFAPLRAQIETGVWLALTSEDCLAEFKRVLNYPLFALPQEKQTAAYAAYYAHIHCVMPATTEAARLALATQQAPGFAPRVSQVTRTSQTVLPLCKDRDDQKFLEAALAGAADWLITGDKALLILAKRARLRSLFRILTPEDALTALNANNSLNQLA